MTHASEILPTADAAQEWGERLAATLADGDVIALCGQLGAGKTQITRGIVAGMASGAEVSSPTFTLVHEYRDGRLPVFHFDFYRMDRAAEVLGIGWDDFLSETGIIVVEWADLFPDLLPDHTQWFRIESLVDGSRSVTRVERAEITPP
ncbi:MAG: tRNA (adenosine(37)-N6)-threonylcarbamoyltransferase complex ATPase subunit type 1 TsaE [Verrucomicrobiaceae bacterium]|nr:tRNA (adenosine(37)-N6)-threonylcarbamoyltransferase complex ATPase subunit type 1 TsaE [Verrucomicrobiaceae bacterium]